MQAIRMDAELWPFMRAETKQTIAAAAAAGLTQSANLPAPCTSKF